MQSITEDILICRLQNLYSLLYSNDLFVIKLQIAITMCIIRLESEKKDSIYSSKISKILALNGENSHYITKQNIREYDNIKQETMQYIIASQNLHHLLNIQYSNIFLEVTDLIESELFLDIEDTCQAISRIILSCTNKNDKIRLAEEFMFFTENYKENFPENTTKYMNENNDNIQTKVVQNSSYIHYIKSPDQKNTKTTIHSRHSTCILF